MSHELGPLARLVGSWEGTKGTDLSPDDDPSQIETNLYREEAVFEPTGEVNNHAQQLFGLRYRMTAWRIDAADPFHEELGYWLWDAANRQVMRCFMVPRGVTLIAGGTADADATRFDLAADLGSATYGICSNPFLDREFQTVRYELSVDLSAEDTFAYRQDTQMKIPGQSEIFHHTDENTIARVK